MNLPLVVILVGLAMSFASWIWFRHPGQEFWFGGPVWKAAKYLKPTGVKLWVVGTVVSMAGVIWLVLRQLSAGV